MLSVHHLEFDYGRQPVLRNLSFDILPGSLVAVLGPNGSGKTTLLRCLNLILAPRGSITLFGENVVEWSSDTLARRIAYMPQRCGISGLTVFDSVLLGRKPYRSWRTTMEDLELVGETLTRLGLETKSLCPLTHLSGGELQKVALARVLVCKPQMILLDEPTSSLDLRNKMEMLSILRRFTSEQKLIVVMTIHDINEALRYADRLLFLKNGSLFADERIETVRGETIGDVYGLPVNLHVSNGIRFITPQ